MVAGIEGGSAWNAKFKRESKLCVIISALRFFNLLDINPYMVSHIPSKDRASPLAL
jgi:hypothetical protein